LAAARSVESGRPDRLVEDRFAQALFDAADADLPMRVDWPDPGSPVSDAEALHLHGSRYIGLRTRFYDDVLVVGAEGGAMQGVLLGAGLDTRALRLGLRAGFRIFELDQVGVLDFKDAVLGGERAESQRARISIRIDLRDDWPAALTSGGFRPEQPTIWVAEGVLAYLEPEAQAALVSHVAELSAPGSALAFDRIAGDPTAGERLRDLSDRSGIDMETLLASGEALDLAGLLRSSGWEVEEEPTTAVAERYGRDLSDPFAAAGAEAASSEPPWLDTVFLRAELPADRAPRVP
jgi:methyltransferase (TIGR00027 family)